MTLSTLHAAKGLEFDTVIFAGFDSERMPHRRSVTRARDELHLTVPLTIGHGRKQKRVARSEFICPPSRPHRGPYAPALRA